MIKADLVIIGGGPGGYVCALRAAQLGLDVCIVDEHKVGGTCLHKGCIPTKALLASAHINSLASRLEEFGFNQSEFSFDYSNIAKRSRKVVDGLHRGLSGLIASNGVKLINGRASFESKNKIIIKSESGDDQVLEFENAVIATGAKPRMIPSISQDLIDSGYIWTSKEALLSEEKPEKLLVIGSGAIGLELSYFFSELGSEVTVVELMDRIIPLEDSDVSDFVKKAMVKAGLNILTSAESSNFREDGGLVAVDIKVNGETQTHHFNKVLVAIGVVPNTNDLNLDRVGVKLKKNGVIEVSEFQQTSAPNIYAIGDVVDGPWLAHKASQEGLICADYIAGETNVKPLDRAKIPGCVYSSPQVASIGISEDNANETGRKVRVGKSYFNSNGKALASGEPEGFVKVIFDSESGELLGASMVGADVTEMIALFSMAMTCELTDQDFVDTIFPHPTMSEVIKEAVLNAMGRSLHG